MKCIFEAVVGYQNITTYSYVTNASHVCVLFVIVYSGMKEW